MRISAYDLLVGRSAWDVRVKAMVRLRYGQRE